MQGCIQDSGLGGGGVQIELPKILGGQHNMGVYRCTETRGGGGIIGTNAMCVWGGGGIIQ